MLTNRMNVSLPIAVWLASDDYDLQPKPKTISVTTLLKPIKALVLSQTITESNLEADVDILDLVAARMGSAIHDAVEHAWTHNLESALINLGYPKKVRDMIKLNPELPVDPENHNIFIEQRTERELNGWTISGKFDTCENGHIRDTKSTSVWSWIYGGNDAKHGMQGSMYRWLNPELVTDDEMDVDFVFTDYKEVDAKRAKIYPPARCVSRAIKLMSINETEHWIADRLALLEKYMGRPEKEIPPCTPAELWQKPSTWKYYKDPAKAHVVGARSTKNFDNHMDAMNKQMADGSVGTIVEKKGVVKFCTFCPARPICQQAERYVTQGLLDI